MGFWNTLRIGASALAAQRLRLDIVSNNIANAETTKTSTGGPYQRQDVVFRPEGQSVYFPEILEKSRNSSITSSLKAGGVEVSKIVTDTTKGELVYDPTHADANEEGYVEYPNVNLVVEMTNMLSATRSYEANLNMISAAKKMAQKALEIGK